MEEVSIHEAKKHWSRLLRKVLDGEEVIITRAGTAIARLVPIEPKQPRIPGRLKNAIRVANDFDEPLPWPV